MRNCFLTLLGLITFFIPVSGQQEAGVSVEVSQTEISLGNALEVTFIVKNSRNGRFTPPDWQNSDWLLQGSSQSSSFSLTNGKAVSSATYRYQLTPRDTGVLEVPTALLKENGKEISTSAVAVKVLPGTGETTARPGMQRRRQPMLEADPKKKIKTIRL